MRNTEEEQEEARHLEEGHVRNGGVGSLSRGRVHLQGQREALGARAVVAIADSARVDVAEGAAAQLGIKYRALLHARASLQRLHEQSSAQSGHRRVIVGFFWRAVRVKLCVYATRGQQHGKGSN